MSEPRRIIVGMTGATGTIIAVRVLQMLQDADVETHLVMSKGAVRTLLHETSYRPEDVERLATRVYAAGDQGAAISSGSFVTEGMIVVQHPRGSTKRIAAQHTSYLDDAYDDLAAFSADFARFADWLTEKGDVQRLADARDLALHYH